MRRIIIGGSVLVIFVTIVIVVLMMLLAPPNYREDVADITASQAEVARVAVLARDNDRVSASTAATAATIASVSLSNVNTLSDYVAENYPEPLSGVELESGVNSAADSRLEAAAASNRLDSEFQEVMAILLDDLTQSVAALQIANEDELLDTVLELVDAKNQLLVEAID